MKNQFKHTQGWYDIPSHELAEATENLTPEGLEAAGSQVEGAIRLLPVEQQKPLLEIIYKLSKEIER